MQINLLGDGWQSENDRPGLRRRRVRVAGEQIGASLYELSPGERTWPYHYEVGHDELLVVITGRPTLRDPKGERELRRGDCVLFPEGLAGVHQVINRSDEPARVLIVSNLSVPRAAFYPDSGKIRVRRSPDAEGALMFRQEDAVDYWEGE